MSDELQALCFLAGANSIFYGEKLLTTGNPTPSGTWHCLHAGPQAHAWSNRGAPCTPIMSKRMRTPQAPVPVTRPARPEHGARELAERIAAAAPQRVAARARACARTVTHRDGAARRGRRQEPAELLQATITSACRSTSP
jgi:hypothetical protein